MSILKARPILFVVFFSILTLDMTPFSVLAATQKPDESQTAKAKKKAKKASGAKITVLPNSGEDFAQRSTRLKHECKGRVNAGACEGYTN